jgi:hypothetical protein
MALFNRNKKKGRSDEDLVHLGSAEHSWWTGETPGETLVDAVPAPGEPPALPVPVLAAVAVAGGESAGPDPEVIAALAAYGNGADPTLSVPVGAEEDAGAVPTVPSDAEELLFLVDGLPDEDHLTELVGALGLEADADWIAIARSHHRLTHLAPGTDAHAEARRRAANEAYARLRLFHH